MKNQNGTKYKLYKEWESSNNQNFDYKKEGLLDKLMSHSIIDSYNNHKNKTLTIILDFFEQSLFFIMDYIERLQHFKDVHWKNR